MRARLEQPAAALGDRGRREERPHPERVEPRGELGVRGGVGEPLRARAGARGLERVVGLRVRPRGEDRRGGEREQREPRAPPARARVRATGGSAPASSGARRGAGRTATTPSSASIGSVTPGMSQSQSTHACTSHATAAASDRAPQVALAPGRQRPQPDRRSATSSSSAAEPEHRPDDAGLGEELQRHAVRLLDVVALTRYSRCVTGNDPAPHPRTGSSANAPDASRHHAHRLPLETVSRRPGS